MLKDFVAFDIEMPTQAVFAISAIGITVVKDGRISDRFYSLVDPQTKFSKYVVELIGITPEMVKGAPTLPQLWKRISAYFTNGSLIVSHGAHGDILTLAAALNRYGIEWGGEISYLCTCDLTLGESPDLEHHSLDYLCEHFGVELLHHNAQSDSDGCAEVLLRYISDGAELEKYIKRVNAGELIERHRMKCLDDKLRQKKKNALKELASPKETAYEFERRYYRSFEPFENEKTAERIRRTLVREGVKVFGLPDETVRNLAGTLTDVQMNNLLPQRRFNCYEMYRLYVYAFNRAKNRTRNFVDLLVSLPSYGALEGIDLHGAAAAIYDKSISVAQLAFKLARQNVFGYNVLAVMLMLESELYETDPPEALKIIRHILIYSPSRDKALMTRVLWMLSRVIIGGGNDDEVVSLLIPKKYLRRAVTMALDDAPEKSEHIENFYAYTLSANRK